MEKEQIIKLLRQLDDNIHSIVVLLSEYGYFEKSCRDEDVVEFAYEIAIETMQTFIELCSLLDFKPYWCYTVRQEK